MIDVDLETAIVLYLAAFLLLILVPWIAHEVRHPQKSLVTERKRALRCDICLHTFIASVEGPSERCPRCKSWVKIRSRASA